MMDENLKGFLAVVFFVVLEVEIIGVIGRNKLLPAVLVRKMTHISCGTTMLLCLALLPMGNSWPGRFSISLFLVCFIVAFSLGAYIPDKDYSQLPAPLKDRIQSLVNSCSRSGMRSELSKGTLFYCVPTAMLVCLFGTAPVTVFTLSALFIGDGVADPVGRVLGSSRVMQYDLKWLGNTKSYPGSLAFLLGSLGASMAFGSLFKVISLPLSALDKAAMMMMMICFAMPAP